MKVAPIVFIVLVLVVSTQSERKSNDFPSISSFKMANKIVDIFRRVLFMAKVLKKLLQVSVTKWWVQEVGSQVPHVYRLQPIATKELVDIN